MRGLGSVLGSDHLQGDIPHLEASTILIGRPKDPWVSRAGFPAPLPPLEEARAAILTSESLLENKHC